MQLHSNWYANLILRTMIEIEVSEYYNTPSFYRYMPEVIFSALEEAYLKGDKKALVPEVEFNEMINNYRNESKTR